MERFQNDYAAVIQKYCMKQFGVPAGALDKDVTFGSDSHPRIAEFFINLMSDVSFNSHLLDASRYIL